MRSSLTPILTVAFLASISTAIGWNGVFFITETAFGYSERANLMLGVALGLVYTGSAFFASGIGGRVRTRGGVTVVSSRSLLALVLVSIGALALLPPTIGAAWAFWVFALGYVVLIGQFWPLIEAYVCAGRRGRELNRATAGFNLSWSSALLPTMWLMGPVLVLAPLWVIGALAPVCVVCVVMLRRFTPEPAPHGEALHEHPPELDALYRSLLRWFRVTLIASYALHAALSPVLPHLMTQLGLDVSIKPALASVWMVTRLGTFLLMGWWPGWHGRRATVVVGVGLMVAGFLATLLAGSVAMMVAGLAMLGVGIGAVYAGAIYYALEVGSTDVDAGGRHEAAIGLGYALGPAGLLLLGGPLGLLPGG